MWVKQSKTIINYSGMIGTAVYIALFLQIFQNRLYYTSPLWAWVAIADINKDDWNDIYVTNDFYGSD
jgi:hypothetical protein